jgi:signal transduction histidine kinase
MFPTISTKFIQGRGYGLVLLLVLVVLVPSICVLWFMNRAVKNERLAVRQKLIEVYRGQLSVVQDRLETHLRQTASELDSLASQLSPAALFAQQVQTGQADALICFDASGNITYPADASPSKPEPFIPGWLEAQQLETSEPATAADAFAAIARTSTNSDIGARALQAQARCLVQASAKEDALDILTQSLAEARFQSATDSQGRLIVPNAELMAIELLQGAPSSSSRVQELAERLKTQLLDYDHFSMPASQRRFLMRQLQALFPNQFQFPTLAAEDLAAEYLETARTIPRDTGLTATPLASVWRLASTGGHVITLHRTANLLTRMRNWGGSQMLPADVTVVIRPPGEATDKFFLSLPAGSQLPGWRLALSLKDERLFDAAADHRIASDVWIGALVLAFVAVLALLVLRLVRRQVALTQLRNDLVANVTHELKTPLSSMRLLVETLLNLPKLNEQTAREYLQLIATENLRLSRLIDNFLTFSRIERNRYTFKFNPVSADEILAAAKVAVQDRFNIPGCRLELQSPPALPAVVADADALVTALINLLDNAYKYSGDNKHVTLSASAHNGSVCFAVKDNGIGLSPRETKRIFKRFYQVDQRMSRPVGGCGLGLSIVKFIVTAHHGQIKVESEPTRGSTFTLILPAATPNSAN